MLTYDEALRFEIFKNGEYKDFLSYLDRLDIIFDIWAYKGFFSEYILSNWYKWDLVLVEAVEDFLNEARNNLNRFKNKIIYENCLIDVSWNKDFYINLDRPWQSWLYFMNSLEFKKDLKFFVNKKVLKLEKFKRCRLKEIVDKYWYWDMGLKMDIEWEELKVLFEIQVVRKFKFFMVEYHLFNEQMKKDFNFLVNLLRKYFDLNIRVSKYTEKIGILIWRKKEMMKIY